MNRSYREEAERVGRGPGLIGEKAEKISGYEHAGWRAVDKMLNGDHPTTNIATVMCAGKHMENYRDGGSVREEQREMVKGERNRMRHNMEKYDHAKKGGHMKEHTSHHEKEAHKKHHEPVHHKKGGHMKHHEGHHKFAAGGVGKIRKGVY